MTALTCIVSAFNRPEHLKLCLQSLKLQTLKPEIIVTDNSLSSMNQAVAESFDVIYLPTKMRTCYEAAEVGATWAHGKYLAFPSDDNWYAPEFAARMVSAGEANRWGLVYCNALFDPRWNGTYSVMDTYPKIGRIDKGGFIVARSIFDEIGEFPGKNGGSSGSDGLLAEKAAQLCSHGKVNEVMWFHG